MTEDLAVRLNLLARDNPVLSISTRELLRKAADQLAAAPAGGGDCTCPSGDGSLRWPCPQHTILMPGLSPAVQPDQLPEADEKWLELIRKELFWRLDHSDRTKTTDNINARIDAFDRLRAYAAQCRRVDEAMVERALEASNGYWSDDENSERCLQCNGRGEVPGPDYCDNCGGMGAVIAGTEEGAMRAALTAALAPHKEG